MLLQLYRDPRFMILALTLVVISGAAGFVTRPKLEDPKSNVRWGYITTHVPGATAQDVEAKVSEPIERAIREAKGIRSIESTSTRGTSVVFVRLTDDVRNVAQVWSRVQDKLTEVARLLPSHASVPVLVEDRRWDAYTTVIALVDKSDGRLPIAVLSRWAKVLDNRLRFVPGTRLTEIFGLPAEEVVVRISEASIADLRLTVEEIAGHLRLRDPESPVATTRSDRHTISLRTNGNFDSLDRIRDVVLREVEGRQVRLRDVAEVVRTEKDPPDRLAFAFDQRSVVVATRMDLDYQIDRWTERHFAALEEFRDLLPMGLEAEVIFSQRRYTDQRAAVLYGSLGLGMLFVVLVVCCMMGWRAAIPICLALPLTVCGVLFLMMPFGVALHQMSIAGLILAIGMLIDNPIIVVDDLQRRLEQGRGVESALQECVRHLMKPLVGSNLTTMLGFSPIMLLPGATGEFLGRLGWAVIACLFVSLMLSLTLVPVLAAWCLRAVTANGTFVRSDVCERTLERMFRHRWKTIAISASLPLLGFMTAYQLREQFFPAAERDHFHFSIRMPTDTSIQETSRVAKRARTIVMSNSGVEAVTLFVGHNAPRIHYSMMSGDDGRPEFAQGIVQLADGQVKPEFIRKVQRQLDRQLPQSQCLVTRIEQGPPAVAPIEFRIYGPSLTTLHRLSDEARRVLMKVPGVIHTRTTQGPGSAELSLNIDSLAAASVGLTDRSIANQANHQLDGLSLSRLSEEIEELPIRVRTQVGEQRAVERAMSIPILNDQFQVVPLGSIAHWSIEPQRFSLFRRNSRRCNTVYAYVAASELPVEIEKRFRRALAEEDFQLPAGYSIDFGGVSRERDAAVGDLLAYTAIIGLLMVSVLVVTFRSFRLASLIGLVGMLAVGLGLLSLRIFDFPIGIVSIIGVLGMMGLAINDSIVVLTDARHHQQRGHPLSKAVQYSTRHVLATSFTTVAGVLPLMLAGGDFWPPMMIVIAGGVVGATMLALGFTPAAYSLMTPPVTRLIR